jgi:hypothetical protein
MTASTKISACPEKRLLVLCARTRLSAAAAKQIEEIVRGPLDWELLLSEATESGVTPLLDRQLRAIVLDSVPSAGKDQLRAACRANTVRSLFLTAELIKILEFFHSAGVQTLPYKGPVLAAQAYGDLALREFGDLDIVLCQRDMAKAHEVMIGLGYHPKFDWSVAPDVAASLIPGEYHYRDEGRRVIVELHTERTLRHFPVPPDLDGLARRSVPVMVGGHEVRTFSVEDNIPILCVHGSKDFWERLSWIADISEMVQSHPNLDWDAVIQRAESFRAQRMLHLGLTLASNLLDAPLPDEIARRVQADHGAAALAGEVERRLLGRNLLGLDAAGRFHFRRRMLPGAFAGWRYTLRLAVMPAEEDWEIARLPGPLGPLYLALRPLRLLRKYGFFSRRAQRLPS